MKITKITKLTDERWLNLFEAEFEDKHGTVGKWQFTSRRYEVQPTPATGVDAVIIVPVHITPNGERGIVVIREFRIPIRDYEYAFPAGLLECKTIEETVAAELFEETGLRLTKIVEVGPPVYSSAGLTDESVSFVFVECEGQISNEYLGKSEEIEAMTLDYNGVCDLFYSGGKFGAKCWPILHGIIESGKI